VKCFGRFPLSAPDSDRIRFARQMGHPLDGSREHMRKTESDWQRVIEAIVVPVHLRQTQDIAGSVMPRPLASKPYQFKRARYALAFFEVALASRRDVR